MSQEVDRRFTFHPASSTETALMHDAVRENHRRVAEWIEKAIPDSRERSLALTALQESMMWCNAAVAYRGGQ